MLYVCHSPTLLTLFAHILIRKKSLPLRRFYTLIVSAQKKSAAKREQSFAQFQNATNLLLL